MTTSPDQLKRLGRLPSMMAVFLLFLPVVGCDPSGQLEGQNPVAVTLKPVAPDQAGFPPEPVVKLDASYVKAKKGAVQAWVRFVVAGSIDAGGLIWDETRFPEAGAIPLFRHLGAEQKFLVTLEAAELGGGQPSGEAVLALMSEALARRFDGAKGDEDLAHLHGYDRATKTFAEVDRTRIKLRLAGQLPAPKLPYTLRRQVDVLAPYLESASFGGPSECLQSRFNLSAETAARLLARSPTFAIAIEHELATLPGAKQEEWMKRAVQDVAPRCEALRSHAELHVYLGPHFRPNFAQPTVSPSCQYKYTPEVRTRTDFENLLRSNRAWTRQPVKSSWFSRLRFR